MGAAAPSARRQRSAPECDERFTHLDLSGLRRYRSVLDTEEGRVSYWRRIVQARLDLVRASLDGRTPDVASLHGVFGHGRPASNRRALVDVLPADDIPPLPDLALLWARSYPPNDQEATRALEHDLTIAERQLSEYRAALHRRLAAATAELIARYHADPSLCLVALPAGPPAQRRAAG